MTELDPSIDTGVVDTDSRLLKQAEAVGELPQFEDDPEDTLDHRPAPDPEPEVVQHFPTGPVVFAAVALASLGVAVGRPRNAA